MSGAAYRTPFLPSTRISPNPTGNSPASDFTVTGGGIGSAGRGHRLQTCQPRVRFTGFRHSSTSRSTKPAGTSPVA